MRDTTGHSSSQEVTTHFFSSFPFPPRPATLARASAPGVPGRAFPANPPPRVATQASVPTPQLRHQRPGPPWRSQPSRSGGRNAPRGSQIPRIASVQLTACFSPPGPPAPRLAARRLGPQSWPRVRSSALDDSRPASASSTTTTGAVGKSSQARLCTSLRTSSLPLFASAKQNSGKAGPAKVC